MKKVLLIRMDRIGDLALTLPADQYFLDAKTTWMVTKGLEFLPENAIPPRNFIAFSRSFSVGQWKKLFLFLKREAFDLSITFHAPWWVNWALFCARIPKRVGNKSQWHAILFLNQGVRQKRSQALKHEAHYNLDLVAESLGKDLDFREWTPLKLESSLPDSDLQKWKLTSHKYFLIHPGMGGSALNWPLAHYAQAARELSLKNQVVITGGPMDEDWIRPLQGILKNTKNILFLENLKILELLLILKNAKCVLAPSTGVLHLAASLETPSLGLYSPIHVERALRWGPLGKRVETLTPSVKNDTKDKVDPSVMSLISVQEVCKKLEEMSR